MIERDAHETIGAYWDAHGNDFLGAVVLPRYGAFVSEEKHRLFGDVSGKTLLEIGCGNGRSLQYHAERGAAALWGMDLSAKQIERASQYLDAQGIPAKLVCSPMEEACGIPEGYFDFVYSIYAIGWTTDLDGTFARIASYLKRGGTFIFSWSHPIHKCVTTEDGVYRFGKRYFDESWYPLSLGPGQAPLMLADRRLSTYINALAQAGFMVEKLLEETDEALLPDDGESDELARRARVFPVTFVIKARKL